jgi:hypothetical protein
MTGFRGFRRTRVVTIIVFGFIAACWMGQGTAADDQESAEFDRLLAWLAGSFASTAQAQEDPEFRDLRGHDHG